MLSKKEMRPEIKNIVRGVAGVCRVLGKCVGAEVKSAASRTWHSMEMRRRLVSLSQVACACVPRSFFFWKKDSSVKMRCKSRGHRSYLVGLGGGLGTPVVS